MTFDLWVLGAGHTSCTDSKHTNNPHNNAAPAAALMEPSQHLYTLLELRSGSI